MIPLPGQGKDLRQKLLEHMGKDPSSFAIVKEKFEGYNHPNLQLALDEFVNVNGRSSTLLGIQGGTLDFMGVGMTQIISPKTMVNMVGFGGAKEGAVEYKNIAIDPNKKLPCVVCGLYLIKDDLNRFAILIKQDRSFATLDGGEVAIEVLCEDKQAAEEIVNFLRSAINKHNVYRGKILSIAKNEGPVGAAAATGLKFHDVPPITREQIILPEGLLQRIERQTIQAGQYSESLKRAKRKLKRGILLHGKPGTGKTLTAMYLSSAMKERTVLIVTGRNQGLIETCCQLSNWLQPSMIVIEDVDLIAEERSQQNTCTLPALYELLNQMDGLSDDSDILFVLTTNRPEILEPALAARPGRVDQAYEIPMPDADCRRRLFHLYSDGLTMEVNDLENFVKRTAGASAAFINELVRKAALFAAPESDPIIVTDKHLDEAMHELLLAGGSLTRSLLGFKEFGFGLHEYKKQQWTNLLLSRASVLANSSDLHDRNHSSRII